MIRPACDQDEEIVGWMDGGARCWTMEGMMRRLEP